jgi:Flp pilus assembly protein CpaB
MKSAESTNVRQSIRSRFWINPRFIVGILLVASAMVGVSALVASADHTTLVYSASKTLSVGQRIHREDLAPAHVRLGSATSAYLPPDRLPDDGAIVTKPIQAGELIPVSAIADASSDVLASVVVAVDGVLAESIVEGSSVDVWAAREGDDRRYGTPDILVSQVTVVRMTKTDAFGPDRSPTSLEIRVPKDRVGALLEATTNSDAIRVVPANLPLGT